MCILLKFDAAQFGVSDLFLSKVIKEKPLGGGGGWPRPPSPLVKEELMSLFNFKTKQHFIEKCLMILLVVSEYGQLSANFALLQGLLKFTLMVLKKKGRGQQEFPTHPMIHSDP